MISRIQLVEEYISKLSVQFQTTRNFDFMRVLVENLIANDGIDILEKIFDIDKAEGKWLDIIGDVVGAYRNDLEISNNESILLNVIYNENDAQSIYNQDDAQETYTIQANYASDFYYRIYIKLKIIQNYSIASVWFISQFFYTFFGNDVYVSFQGAVAPTTIALFAIDSLFDFIKSLAIRDLLPRPIAFNWVIVKQPPEGYYYFGFFSRPYQDVIDGKISLTKYNELAISLSRYSYNDDEKTIYLPSANYFIVNG